MRKNILVLILVIASVIGAYWVSTHGYLEIQLQFERNAETTIQITDQASGNLTEVTTKNSSFKKLLRRGKYELLVKQNNKSYFAVTKTNGWLGKTSTKAELAAEKQRQFIGDNPGPCAAYNNQVLLTFACNDSYRNTLIHIPATSKLPTYSLKPSKSVDGYIEGIVQTSEGTVAVLKRPSNIDNDAIPPHTAYLLNSSSELTGGIALKDLDDKKTYTVRAYKQGLLFYDDSVEKLLYFPTRNSTPSEVKLDVSKKMTPYQAYVSNNNVLITAAESGKSIDPDDPKTAKLKSEVVILTGQETKRFTLSKRYSSILVCGPSKLCTLLNKRLGVHDISSDKPKLLFEVLNVDQVEEINGRVIMIRGTDTLTLDTDKRTGSIDFSLGAYKACGLFSTTTPADKNSYTLCLINNRGDKVAALVNPLKADDDSIDKKAIELLKMKEIKSLSVYANYIHLTPQVGEPVYDPKVRSFRYDPVKLQSTNTVINQAIDRIGIDRAKYQIINPLAGG